MKNRQKQKKKSKRLLLCILCICVIIGIGILIKNIMNYPKNEYTGIDRTATLEKMQKTNKEVLGWLAVQGTDIDYPVIDYSQVESYYDLEYTFVWKNTSTTELEDKVTIMGHNFRNVSSKPLIADKEHIWFEQLPSFVYYDFAKKNQYIQYTINGKNYIYKIYSVTFSNTDEEIANSEFIDTKSKKEYIHQVMKNSLFDYKIDVNENDPLISLVTCTRMFGAENTDAKIKVEGRLLRKNENTKNYKVKISDSYDELMGGKMYEK